MDESKREILIERLRKAREAKAAKKQQVTIKPAAVAVEPPVVAAVSASEVPVVKKVAAEQKKKPNKPVPAPTATSDSDSDDDDEPAATATAAAAIAGPVPGKKYKMRYSQLLARHESLLEAVSSGIVKALNKAPEPTAAPPREAPPVTNDPPAAPNKPHQNITKDNLKRAAQDEVLKATMRKLFG
jgi:hypothetical protein